MQEVQDETGVYVVPPRLNHATILMQRLDVLTFTVRPGVLFSPPFVPGESRPALKGR